MTEAEYLQQRIKDLIENSCDPARSEQERQNQREALRFHLNAAKPSVPPCHSNQTESRL